MGLLQPGFLQQLIPPTATTTKPVGQPVGSVEIYSMQQNPLNPTPPYNPYAPESKHWLYKSVVSSYPTPPVWIWGDWRYLGVPSVPQPPQNLVPSVPQPPQNYVAEPVDSIPLSGSATPPPTQTTSYPSIPLSESTSGRGTLPSPLASQFGPMYSSTGDITDPLATIYVAPIPGKKWPQYWDLLSEPEKKFGEILWQMLGTHPESKYVQAYGWEGARELLTNPRKFFLSTRIYKQLIQELGIPQTPEEAWRFFEAYNRKNYEYIKKSMEARGATPPPFEEAMPGWRPGDDWLVKPLPPVPEPATKQPPPWDPSLTWDKVTKMPWLPQNALLWFKGSPYATKTGTAPALNPWFDPQNLVKKEEPKSSPSIGSDELAALLKLLKKLIGG